MRAIRPPATDQASWTSGLNDSVAQLSYAVAPTAASAASAASNDFISVECAARSRPFATAHAPFARPNHAGSNAPNESTHSSAVPQTCPPAPMHTRAFPTPRQHTERFCPRMEMASSRGEIASVRDGARTVRTLSARRFQRAAPRPPRPRRRCAATRLLQQMTQADPQQPSAHFFFDEQKDMWSILARRCVCGAPRCGTGRRLGRVPTRAMDPRGPAHSFGRFRGARRRRGVDPA